MSGISLLLSQTANRELDGREAAKTWTSTRKGHWFCRQRISLLWRHISPLLMLYPRPASFCKMRTRAARCGTMAGVINNLHKISSSQFFWILVCCCSASFLQAQDGFDFGKDTVEKFKFFTQCCIHFLWHELSRSEPIILLVHVSNTPQHLTCHWGLFFFVLSWMCSCKRALL